MDQVEERVGQVRNLPADAESPAISRILRSEPVARVLVAGSGALAELRPLARRMERELLARGLAKVEKGGCGIFLKRTPYTDRGMTSKQEPTMTHLTYEDDGYDPLAGARACGGRA